MKQIEASIKAAARLQGLADFERYPFMRSIAGVPAPGEELSVRSQPPGQRGLTFRPAVLRA